MTPHFNIDKILRSDRLFLIAGPCAAESLEMCQRVAQTLCELSLRYDIPYIFKASYAKANRLSGESYHGPGREEGLRILEKIRREFEIPVLTDVHETTEVAAAAEVVDVLQIPAFLCRQTELVRACAQTGKWVNIKKGQFMAPHDMRSIVKKASYETDSPAEPARVMLTERGSFFGYNNLVVDFRSLLILRESSVPVIFDATHSLQLPGAAGLVPGTTGLVPGVTGNSSGGQPQFVLPFCRAAVAIGVDGLFIETHPDPATAKSDSQSMIPLSQMDTLLREVVHLRNVVNHPRVTTQEALK